ncbi:chromate transporter [Paenibacillus sp. N4]|uniref:chromate transporter n=1 Tax=Paenibacillus vietnamensis TaxID=2590547 RepID=UPI001CD090E9|nr:chromate transporter [Paenibacillus vietnamensis]MCA0756178.1 chromate transporter [Paenibacillus vietnamensis]
MLWNLFLFFLKIGFLSFGGGYAVIPMIRYGLISRGWIDEAAFQEAVSLSGMAPGPIATNSATLIGYRIAGWAGAAAATAGIILPSLLIIICIALFFYKLRHNKWVKASLYGLRPIVTALILISALHYAFPIGFGAAFHWQTAAMLLICAASVVSLLKYKHHPLLVIAAAGIAGIVLF